MNLTDYDRSLILLALVTAESALRDRISRCMAMGHGTDCPFCQERLDAIEKCSALAIQLRTGS